MKKIMTITISTVLVICINTAHCYEENAHRKINKTAAAQSNLGTGLNTKLGFSNGIETKFGGKEVWEWFEEGARLEDATICRSKFHFHDPTKSFDGAGLGKVS